MNGPKKQRGISMFMLVCIFGVCAVFGLVGLKVTPYYLDYYTYKKILKAMSTSEEVKSGTVADIRKSFDRRTTIDYAKGVEAADLEITKEGGETVVSAAWSPSIPLFSNWVLQINFTASSNDQ